MGAGPQNGGGSLGWGVLALSAARLRRSRVCLRRGIITVRWGLVVSAGGGAGRVPAGGGSQHDGGVGMLFVAPAQVGVERFDQMVGTAVMLVVGRVRRPGRPGHGVIGYRSHPPVCRSPASDRSDRASAETGSTRLRAGIGVRVWPRWG